MMRVLIIDDHAIVRRGLKEVFTEAFPDSEVGEAENSRAAAELVAAQEWDVVLLDINLPGRSGLEVLEEIKESRPKTPVLVLSAYPEEEFAIRSLRLGASGFLNKSLSSDEVVVAVKRVLTGKKYVTALISEKLIDTLGNDFQNATHETLSSRELQVLQMVAQGKSSKAIAAELALSEKTVGTYRNRISKKMGLSTNVELTRYALKNALVD
jgi:two-component system invasion response regulator UvrY